MSFNLLFRQRFGILFISSLVASMVFIIGPYFYFLGRDHYIPKTNPNAGYFMPNSFEAWFSLALALALLGLSFAAFYLFYREIRSKGFVLSPGIDLN